MRAKSTKAASVSFSFSFFLCSLRSFRVSGASLNTWIDRSHLSCLNILVWSSLV